MSDSFFRKAMQEKMGEGAAQPGSDLWDEINGALAQKRAANKKKNRFLLCWLLPMFLLVGGSLFYFINKKSETTIIEKPIVEIPNVEMGGTSKVQMQVIDNQNISKGGKQILVEKKQPKSKISKTKFPIKTNSSISSKFQKQGQLGNLATTVTWHLGNPTPNSISQLNSEIEKNNFTAKELGNNGNSAMMATRQLDNFLPLVLEPQLLEVNVVQPEITELKIAKTVIEKEDFKKQNFSIGINYGINQLEYCFDEKANSETAQLKIGYRFHKYLSAGIGLGFHNVNYDFEVNSSDHIASFGDTDKYPSFYKLKNDVAQIESRLSYFTLPVSLNFHLPVTKQLTATLTANQDLAYNQDQLMIYSFKSGTDDLEFRETNSKLDLGFTTFRLGFDYPMMDGLRAEVGFNRIITFQTLGIESQYYHGFGGDFGLRYDF